MSRAIEHYICASEDRSHYNNETYRLRGFLYPAREPHITIIQEVYKEEKVSDERLNELIDARIPGLTETVVNEVIPAITEGDWEVHGGSASEVIDLQEDG